MNKNVIGRLAIVVAAIAFIFAYSLYTQNNRTVSTPASPQEIINFSETGNLVKGNPGLKQNIWYLVYEKPGQPALTAELVFDEKSLCDNRICDTANLNVGSRKKVEGVKQNEIVLVKKISSVNNQDTTSLRTVKLYYYNQLKDKEFSGNSNILCSRDAVLPVERQIAATKTPIQDTVKLLLRGEISDEEKQLGFSTELASDKLALVGANLNSGILSLEFDDPENFTSGGSCRVSLLWYQIEKTAKQFPEVKEVRFIPEELFQP